MAFHRNKRIIIQYGIAIGLMGVTSLAFASAFQLWEGSAAGTGTYHAGGAAIAEDASTGYYNPAGLIRLKHQEISLGMAYIDTNILYKGNVKVSIYPTTFTNVRSQGGDPAFIPNFHYALPINDHWAFGFGITIPLGLDTNYDKTTDLRYAATKSLLQSINISPSVGYKINDHLSVGAGFDAQRLKAQFDQYGMGFQFPATFQDATNDNKFFDWGYGYHLGALYQITPSMRVGLSYHSKITHHAEGSSTFTNLATGEQWHSANAKTTLIMPATTMLSFFQDINKNWAWAASVTYTQWSSFKTLVLKNILAGDTPINVSVPQHFRNTWNLALGGIYTLNDMWKFKAGIGYDESPVTTKYRTVQVPDNNRFATAIGVHFQPIKALGFDLGWAHIFIKRSKVNSSVEVGPETISVDGNVDSGADVLGLQMTYDVV